jgi:sigma-B regulation protein RsbU (phosphoserine phosphatase)
LGEPVSRILFVVDEAKNRRALHEILGGEGYELLDAPDGESALEVAAEALPCVILLDLAGCGAPVLAKLKSDPRTRGIAVVVLSALGEAADLMGDPETGAADYIAKPFEPAEVLARVRSQVTIRRLERSLAERNRDLERANQQMRGDLDAAALVQRSLLPRGEPDVPGVRFAWHYQPCLALAGDSLGVLPIDERHVAVYVLDVSGHGVSSALLSVAVTRVLGLRSDPAALVSERDPGGSRVRRPSEVAARLNQLFPMGSIGNQFFTLVYGILDPRTGRFEFVSPGNPGPIVARPGEVPRVHDRPALAVGMFAEAEYEDSTIELEPGDRLYLHTDGLTDERNAGGDAFGRDRLLQEIQRVESMPFDAALKAVAQASRDWRGAWHCRDDIALLGLEYRGG